MFRVKLCNVLRKILPPSYVVLRNRNIVSSIIQQTSVKNVPQFYKYSTASTVAEVDYKVFDKVCEETLESLTEFFEELIENNDKFKSGDVSFSGGVLTINLGAEYGTYVINRQSPNKQIWLSSPTSGPKRYDLVSNGSYWIYKHDGQTLHKLLEKEFSAILGTTVDLKQCAYSKI